jgi:hypothetical protein
LRCGFDNSVSWNCRDGTLVCMLWTIRDSIETRKPCHDFDFWLFYTSKEELAAANATFCWVFDFSSPWSWFVQGKLYWNWGCGLDHGFLWGFLQGWNLFQSWVWLKSINFV